jgi:hypothetical protein
MIYPTSVCLALRVFSAIAASVSFLHVSLQGQTSAENLAELHIDSPSVFRFGGLEFFAGHFDAEWKHTALPPKNKKTPAAALLLSRDVRQLDARTVQAVWRFTLPPETTELSTAELYAGINFPVALYSGQSVTFDGTTVKLPAPQTDITLATVPFRSGQVLILPGAEGTVTVEGDFGILLQDQRRWQRDSYGVRMRIEPVGQKISDTEITLSLIIKYDPWHSEPVSLREAANRGFRDEVAGDGIGGWTDQGPANDLATLPQGQMLNTSGIAFDIIDPDTNGGRSALVFERKKKATVTLPILDASASAAAPVWQTLCLLHASAWQAETGSIIGTVVARYTDGTETVHEVAAGRDVSDWWMPLPLANAAIGWSGRNANSSIGLFVSRFTLAPKPLAEIRLEATGKSTWMVAGVTGSPDTIALSSVVTPLTVAAGRDWAPIHHSVEIEPGGVFDFSSLNSNATPAGVHGPLVATPAGHFEFAGRPGSRVRLWGVNLVTGAQFLTKPAADRLAERLARSGYNTVRMHHFDLSLTQPGKPSWELDPQKLDQLDYLFAALKARGLHINIDLFSLRGFSAPELTSFGLDPAMNRGDSRSRFKALLPISEPAFESWSRFSTALLTHRNPHTGLTWAEDPALIGICPVNEDTLSEAFLDRYPEIRRRYDVIFGEWKKTTKTPASFGHFLVDVQQRADARMFALLRSLDVKALLSGANYKSTLAATYLRENYDYVDNHQYWDHPLFPETLWATPFTLGQTSATRYTAQLPRQLMPTRVFGRPYVVTEFNYVRPNRYRAEGGVLMPAYASLQDWDGLYNYKYANSPEIALEGVIDRYGIFSIASDPINLLADRVAALIFRRGDIAPARDAVAITVGQPTDSELEFPHAFSLLGLVKRIGSRTSSVPEGGPEEWRPSDAANSEQRFVSDTGEIDLRADAGSLRVVTPRSELFVLPPQTELQGGAVVRIKNGDTFCAVSVVSLDERPVADSNRLLVLHLTDVLPAGMRFSDTDRRRVEDRGRGPLLVQRGATEILLRLGTGEDKKQRIHVWAVDVTGHRMREVPFRMTPDGLLLNMETVTSESVQLAYEITRE